jgi:hypothetical protein
MRIPWLRSQWPFKKIELPEEPNGTGKRKAEEAKRSSEQKLRDAVRSKREVSKEVDRIDNFALALERAMRRRHG